MKPPIQVGLIGFGTVGTGVVKILQENADLITKRVGAPIALVRIADLDVTTDRGVSVPKGVLTTDVRDILDDPDIDIVVELIGGHEPAKQFILQALERKKCVVTANKALLADHGEDVFEAAFKAGVDLGFEASVGGGIPVIRSLTEGLAANRILSITGIMNGTSNYILTRMTNERRDFGEILEEAKREGYAEADPSLDVDGIDAAHKLAIMVMKKGKRPKRSSPIPSESSVSLPGNLGLRSSCWESPNYRKMPLRHGCTPPWCPPDLLLHR